MSIVEAPICQAFRIRFWVKSSNPGTSRSGIREKLRRGALQTLLAGYSKTEYGARFGASSTASVGDLVRVRLVSELGEPLHEWGPTCPARVGNLALYVEDGELQVTPPEFHHPLKAEVVRADHRSLPSFQQIPSQRACLLVGFDRPDERPV